MLSHWFTQASNRCSAPVVALFYAIQRNGNRWRNRQPLRQVMEKSFSCETEWNLRRVHFSSVYKKNARHFSKVKSDPKLTVSNGVLLEKMLILQLVRNLPTFHRTPRSIAVFTRACHLPLSRTRWMQYTPSHIISLQSILVFIFNNIIRHIGNIFQTILLRLCTDIFSVSR